MFISFNNCEFCLLNLVTKFNITFFNEFKNVSLNSSSPLPNN